MVGGGQEMQPKNLISARLRQARKALGLTQAQLAAQLQYRGTDIAENGVAKIENGWRQVSDVELVALAAALRVSASWLLGETDNPKRSPKCES